MRNIQDLFTYENSYDKLLKSIIVIIILAGIGILRVALQVLAQQFAGRALDDKWFSYDPDILFSMAFYPFYLTFFMFFALYFVFKIFRVKFSVKKLIVFLFFINFLHLLIPVLDGIGLKYDIPWNTLPYLNAQGMSFGYSLNPFADLPSLIYLPIYFTPLILFFTLVTTLGINAVWLIVGGLFLRLTMKEFKISFVKSLAILLIMFQIIYWPIYKYYFVFNNIFNSIFSLDYFNYFGYGTFFLLGGLIGMLFYFRVAEEKIT